MIKNMDTDESPFIITKKDVDWAVAMYYDHDYLIKKDGIINKYPHITTHSQWVKEFGPTLLFNGEMY